MYKTDTVMDIYEITYYYNGKKEVFLAYITRNPFLKDNEILNSVKRELYKYLGTTTNVEIISIKPYKEL